MHGKLCLVTGANSGIGKQTALELARLGARVMLLCRDPTKGQDALEDIRVESGNGAVELEIVDLGSQRSIRRFAQTFNGRHHRLDVLINNAGVYHRRRQITEDGIEATLAVNHLGPFLLTRLLMDALMAPGRARIVNVASQAHRYRRQGIDFDDIQFERSYRGTMAYAQSKLANILFTYSLARRLNANRVTVNCLHPGVVTTGFFRELPGPMRWFAGRFLAGVEAGARTSVHLASAPEVEGITGTYFINCRQAQSRPTSHDREAGERLWRLSEQWTGLEPWPA